MLNECWPAPAMMLKRIHVEDIFQLFSLILSLIISWRGFWPMKKTNTLLYRENIKPIFLFIALKQTKAGPRSSVTPVLVITVYLWNIKSIAWFPMIYGNFVNSVKWPPSIIIVQRRDTDNSGFYFGITGESNDWKKIGKYITCCGSQ